MSFISIYSMPHHSWWRDHHDSRNEKMQEQSKQWVLPWEIISLLALLRWFRFYTQMQNDWAAKQCETLQRNTNVTLTLNLKTTKQTRAVTLPDIKWKAMTVRCISTNDLYRLSQTRVWWHLIGTVVWRHLTEWRVSHFSKPYCGDISSCSVE